MQPVLIHEDDCPREGSGDKHLGDAAWRTLLSGDTTPSLYMTCGIVEVGTWRGGEMESHQHPQSEIYHVLEGQGVVNIDGEEYFIRKGSTLFIPGCCTHGTRNTDERPLKIFYVFAVDSFQEVEYLVPTRHSQTR